MGPEAAVREDGPPAGRVRYAPPRSTGRTTLKALLAAHGRPALDRRQYSLFGRKDAVDAALYYAGDLDLLRSPSVAIVGARDVSERGAARARRLAREIAEAGVTVVSGLAKGVDVNAHTAAIAGGGRTAAVVGTPLDRAYPAEHGELQALIAERHVLLSPFAEGTKVYPSNFPQRNRVMAALTDGTVIVEASDTSGTLHQAAECQQLGRWLFILKSVLEDPDLKWPKSFLAAYDRTLVVESTQDVVDRIRL